ncbi:MAG: acetate--CoA ligase family protein, partial [Acidiferrobacterales bacterium]|nr:acetate--CoA ligase family protein [Acidiferrobacterales bacterium]
MPTIDLATALFAPGSVALVGASADPGKNTARPQRFLRRHGYTGRIVPINTQRSEVLGEPAYPDLRAAPGPIDHAFIMVPAEAVPDVITQCGEAKIPVVTIYSDGFAECGETGHRRQEQIVAIAKKSGVRLLGPNSMGVINTHTALPLAISAVLEGTKIWPGTLAVISQSGTMLGALLSRGQARGIGFSKLISVGNEADLSVGEITELLVADPDTTAILLFLETLRDPQRLAAAARRAFGAGKPVIAYKLGCSEAGRKLANSHSGAICGPHEAVNAFLQHQGIIRVDMMETLFEMPTLVSGHKPANERRVAVLTTTGGGAAMVVDQLGMRGISVVSAPAHVRKTLADRGVTINSHAPLVDLTMAGTRKGIYGAALQELMQSPECDAVVAVVGSSAQFHPELAVEPIVRATKSNKPLATFTVPQADESLALLAGAGIAAFRTPEACADAIRAYLDWRAPVTQPAEPSQNLSAVTAALRKRKQAKLDEAEAREVFQALGIAQAPAHLINEPQDGSPVGYPVALKIISADILHKTEARGVALDIKDAAGLQAAAREMLAHIKEAAPQAQIKGLLVQRMQSGLAEVLLGYKRDPEAGPTVILGMGGQLAEIYRDFSVRLAPVTPETARAMIDEVRGLAVIRGYR